MFGLFKTPAYNDAVLGELQRKGGYWRGTITLAGEALPLAMIQN